MPYVFDLASCYIQFHSESLNNRLIFFHYSFFFHKYNLPYSSKKISLFCKVRDVIPSISIQPNSTISTEEANITIPFVILNAF